MTGWWRTNRLWLVALPVALAVMLGASAYRVPAFLYDQGPNDALGTADQGELLEVTDEFTDAVGDTTRTLSVRLSGLEPVAEFPYDDSEGERPPPDGLEAVAVDLDWAADPDQVLRGCAIELEDADGRRYGLLPGSDSDQPDACVPEDAGGPEAPFVRGAERGALPYGEDPRPATWSTAPVFLVPAGREFTRVLVYWTLPAYAGLSVS